MTIVGGKGGEQVFVNRVPKIDINNNPYINKIVPLEEDIDSIAKDLDSFYLMQDPSILSGWWKKVINFWIIVGNNSLIL